MKSNLTALIIAKNEEKMLQACLETLAFCDKIIVLDTGSSDRTSSIAEDYNCKVVSFAHESFAKLREKAQSLVEMEWLFYVDADERVTPALAKEILLHIEKDDCRIGKMIQSLGFLKTPILRVGEAKFMKAQFTKVVKSSCNTN